MEATHTIKTWQKALSVFLAILLTATIWGVPAEPAYAQTGESGNDLTYDTAIGVFGDHAFMSTRTSTSVNGAPSIQTDQAIVSTGGVKSITSQKHQGAGSGTNSAVQIAGLINDGSAVSMTNSEGMFGVSKLNGHTIVPVEYIAVASNSSGGMFYAVKSSGNQIVLDTYNASGTRRQSINVGSGTPTNVAVFPDYVQVYESVSTSKGHVNAAKVFSITSSGLEAEPNIVMANANDDSGTAFIKNDGTVWYKPSEGSATQIATGANTSARIELLEANYAKVKYPKGKTTAYVTSTGAESSEGVISAMANRILAPQTSSGYGELGYANNELIAKLNGQQFLWEGSVIVGFTPTNSEGACNFWVYSAKNGKLIHGATASSTQVKLERQGDNYAITYTPTSGSQTYAGLYYNANLEPYSLDCAPSRLGGSLKDGRTIQVAQGTDGTYKYYQVTDVYGNAIECGNYTLALGYVEGIETMGAGDATPRVQHSDTDLYCAQDANGNYGAVNSAGAVYVPFIYDNYFDLGYISADASLNNSKYVMVHRDGQWFFFDVANAKEITQPVATTPTQPSEKKISISKAKVKIKSRVYTGKRLSPKNIKVWYNGKKLVRNRDYKVYYNRGVHVGRYRVTIRGIGRYSGTYRTYYHIVPRRANIYRMHRFHRGFRLYWHPYNREMTGYELRYSWDRHFRHDVHVRYFNRNHRAYYNARNLRAHRYYYAQMRLYKDVHGKRYYSGWSDIWRTRTL